MTLGWALRELHRDEDALAGQLSALAERHRADHEVHHLARDLAGWSRRHLTELPEHARRYGVSLAPDPDSAGAALGPLALPGLLGPEADDPLALLRDLRRVYVHASGVSVDWEMVAQAAQATGDTALLALVRGCHPDTLRQLRWLNAQLKEVSPRLLVSRDAAPDSG